MQSVLEEYRQYQVPDEDLGRLVSPEINEIQAGLGRPSEIGRYTPLEFCGKPLDQVRQQAREEVVRLALEHVRKYSNVPDISPEQIAARPIVLSGHQPELFHAGVWFKNFLLGKLVDHSQAISVNFLVDNDLCRSTAIRVPTQRDNGVFHSELVPFDVGRNSIPWELRGLESKEVWKQFPALVQSKLAHTNAPPLLQEFWPRATKAVQQSGRIGLALAQARHLLELEVGLKTLEVPLSQLVSTRAFARFSIQLLSELPRFQEIYNKQRDRYRAAHRIRNSAHPVPELEQSHGWFEAPWWVYRIEAPKRQPLWVRLQDDQLILSDRQGWQETIEGRLDCDNAATQWLEILAEGACIRPRALLTTMYLRLFVGDLFVHGIGGGKYDQLTDGILNEFFDVEPPPMAVATATLKLPLADAADASQAADLNESMRHQRQRLWDLRYHADRILSEDPKADQLRRHKLQLLENIPPRGEKWKWHQEISSVNRQLSQLTTQHSEAAHLKIASLNEQLKQQHVLHSREYSFCLFPRSYIIQRLKQLAEL